jgi:hypothetical protein
MYVNIRFLLLTMWNITLNVSYHSKAIHMKISIWSQWHSDEKRYLGSREPFVGFWHSPPVTFFLQYWDFNSGPLPEVTPKTLLWFFIQLRSHKQFSNCYPFDLCLLSPRNSGVSHQYPVSCDYLKAWIITNLPCGTLHIKPLCQPCFVLGNSEIWSIELFSWTAIQPWPSWSLSWVTRIIGMSHHRHASLFLETESCNVVQTIIEQTM